MAKYYLIGIGGIGVSGLARILKAARHEVIGSDIKSNSETEALVREGFKVYIGHNADQLSADTTAVVVSSAIPTDNPEINKAGQLGIPVLKRSKLLGDLMKSYYGIGVAGTHGKTTTTNMLAQILIDASTDPTALVGGIVKSFGESNVRVGRGKYFVTEADEYSDSFLDLNLRAAIVNNIEADHLDYFKDFDGVIKSFTKFVQHLGPSSILVLNTDSEATQTIARGTNARLFGFGEKLSSGLMVQDIELTSEGSTFTLATHFGPIETIALQVPGKHNVLNAAGAYILAVSLGIEPTVARKSLEAFTGTERRFELKSRGEWTLVDDYGHHPTEIKATLLAARQMFPDKKILAIFEAHQYSRTRLLLDEFGQSFASADAVLVAPIYRVRDSDEDASAVSVEQLVEQINKYSKNAKLTGGYQEIAEYVRQNYDPKEWAVITIGAGPINQVIDLIGKLDEIV